MTYYYSDPFWDSFFWGDQEEKKESWETPKKVFDNIADFLDYVERETIAPQPAKYVRPEINPVKYVHLWENTGYGFITVAYRKESDKVLMGFSFCMPEDQFCKKEGRDRATERLLNGKYVLTQAEYVDGKFSIIETVRKFFDSVLYASGHKKDGTLSNFFNVNEYQSFKYDAAFEYWIDAWITLWLNKWE
jgi:hypothetical protein